jgi:hypothetical protein
MSEILRSLLGLGNTNEDVQVGGYSPATPYKQPGNLVNGGMSAGSLGAVGGSVSTLSPNWLQSMTGYTDPASGAKVGGWGSLALGAAQGIGSAYMGSKQLSLAQDTFKENKRQFQMNYNNQKKTVNTQLEDRQRARVASNSGAYQSVGDYMNKNGL